jgi:hypothetical protein
MPSLKQLEQACQRLGERWPFGLDITQAVQEPEANGELRLAPFVAFTRPCAKAKHFCARIWRPHSALRQSRFKSQSRRIGQAGGAVFGANHVLNQEHLMAAHLIETPFVGGYPLSGSVSF